MNAHERVRHPATRRPTIRPELSEAAATFWDTHADFFDDVMYSGASGGLAKALTYLATAFGLWPLLSSLSTST